MKVRRFFGVSSAAIALAIGFTAQASAADAGGHGFFTGDPFGKVTGYSGGGTFKEHGDYVGICDTKADGSAVRLHVYKGGLYQVRAYSLTIGGKGNCTGKNAADGGNYNLPENTKIGFLFCRYKGGVDSECSGHEWVNDN
ncbi:hypothetical protein ACFU9B_04740 [Streptomyces sp. NPDC057592]|uniref:hypothetical protein n=1 Tax=unclassified Streptomyces TaxID=2593676 RepID=UPI0036C3671D